jgi:hypothetical protein
MSLSRFSGVRDAYQFAYGVNPNVGALAVKVGNSATGAGNTITVDIGQFVTADGILVNPFSTTAPITIGTGSQAETVTPSAVSNPTPGLSGTCVITANFTKLHAAFEPITSATVGMAEAVNHVHSKGGGLVSFDASWIAAGGATSQFAGKTYGWANVTLLDERGTSSTASPATSWRSGSATAPTDGGAYVASAVALY